jgi:HSP20 family protein
MAEPRTNYSRHNCAVVTIFPDYAGAPRAEFTQPVPEAPIQIIILQQLATLRPLVRRLQIDERQTNSPAKEKHTMNLVRYSYPSYRNMSPANSAFVRSPWSGLETEIDRLFETALTEFGGDSSSHRFPVDLYEDKENTYVRAELPGVNRDDINVEMVDGYLTITGARKMPAGSENDGESEESFSFSRSVSIADEVQADKVAATYENGVLTVTLPKREESKPRKIAVAVK